MFTFMVWLEGDLTNPVLIEMIAGSLVEKTHRGSVAIVNSTGNTVFALGDVESPIFPRSSLKPIQALVLIESGALDAFDLGDREIALACASHSGEPMHTALVNAWLKRIDCRESDLACGPQPVRYVPVWEAMVKRSEQPNAVHNNCSGKHAAFLTVARHWGIPTAGYEKHDHPVQRAVAKTLSELSGATGEFAWGIDGCSAPNFALPLAAFARALAAMAARKPPTTPRAAAARRIIKAMIAHPELVGGTGRVCTALIRACEGRAVVKVGAEGVYAAILPGAGLGVALKIDDGSTHAAEIMIATLLESLEAMGEGQSANEILGWSPLERAVITSEILELNPANLGPF